MALLQVIRFRITGQWTEAETDARTDADAAGLKQIEKQQTEMKENEN